MNPKAYSLLMIRPAKFAYNAETAVNNAFQVNEQNNDTQELALNEFDHFVAKLKAQDIDVIVINDTLTPHTPDSIFPNNWISFHEDGTAILYPMFAKNRQAERKESTLDAIYNQLTIQQTIDFSVLEKEEIYLEGTGSIIFDHPNKIAYACISPRTDENLFRKLCAELSYEPIVFEALDGKNQQIYHTNVMMCLADRYAVICLDSIQSEYERYNVVAKLQATNKIIIDITLDQVNQFAGNMLQVWNRHGKSFLVMSSSACNTLTKDQLSLLESLDTIISVEIPTIETNGGGSARCMMAEINLNKKEQ